MSPLERFCKTVRDETGWTFEVGEDSSVTFKVDLVPNKVVWCWFVPGYFDFLEADQGGSGIDSGNDAEEFASVVLGDLGYLDACGQLSQVDNWVDYAQQFPTQPPTHDVGGQSV